MKRLTTSDINWNTGAQYAYINKSRGVVYQHSQPAFYHENFFYCVERDAKQAKKVPVKMTENDIKINSDLDEAVKLRLDFFFGFALRLAIGDQVGGG